MEFLLLLGTPLAGAVILGWYGGRRLRARAQRRVLADHLPRGVRARLAGRGLRQPGGGARTILHRRVQRVPGGADRVHRPDDVAVFAPLHAHRGASRTGVGGTAAPVPQHVSVVHGDDADRADDQQHGASVGRHGGRHPLDGVAGHAVPNRREPRGGLEILHSVRRRHFPGAFRHDSSVFRRREGPRLGGRERAALDASQRGQGPARARGARPRVRLSAGRVRHQGGSRTVAQLAARCARGGPDAHIRGLVRTPAQCGDVRGRALQGAGGRLAAVEPARAAC